MSSHSLPGSLEIGELWNQCPRVGRLTVGAAFLKNAFVTFERILTEAKLNDKVEQTSNPKNPPLFFENKFAKPKNLII